MQVAGLLPDKFLGNDSNSGCLEYAKEQYGSATDNAQAA